MELNQNYQNILDVSFRKHFPEWDAMSPLDPTKVFAESIACSLAAVENRQNRILSTVLDSLPSLFGVTPKAGQLPVTLFSLKPSFRSETKSNDKFVLTSRDRIKFQKGVETLYVIPKVDIQLMPISRCDKKTEENKVTLTLRCEKGLSELDLQFLPNEESKPNRLMKAILVSDSSESLSCEEDTHSFTAYGEIKIKKTNATPLTAQAEEFSLELLFEQPFKGEVHLNLFPFFIAATENSLSLGTIEGEAWEEMALPQSLPEAPKEVLLRYPSGESRTLTRIPEEALKTRVNELQKFNEGFLYHPVRHSLIFPAADILKRNYNGGITLHLQNALLYPKENSIPEGFQVVLGAFASHVSEITALVHQLFPVKRENPQEYLDRFYSLLRSFHGDKGNLPGLFLKDLAQQILSRDNILRRVEISHDLDTKKLTVFCLTDNPLSTQALYLDQTARSRVENLLARLVPLQYNWELSPFSTQPFYLQFNIDLEMEDSRWRQWPQEAIENLLTVCCQKLLLPPPFGGLEDEVLLDKKRFLELLKNELITTQDHDNRFLVEEISRLDVLFKSSAGHFLQSFSRAPGLCLVPHVSVKALVKIQSEKEYLHA